ncbi:uncharacterized protein EAE98_002081 [Botrytis deweyae]|uniref:ABC transmembrane type-1 domain-containing protein n=1 Tax=Botrytis deweyae TaxID=2478750 RepID=A0ABQ7IWA7_9HELO|nr:uncharacterized protein EAE98_002081 [Botrytis deweyae]KAF7935861.1 hypothetical protein EAE98_002081 [Botrytis deweyae]
MHEHCDHFIHYASLMLQNQYVQTSSLVLRTKNFLDYLLGVETLKKSCNVCTVVGRQIVTFASANGPEYQNLSLLHTSTYQGLYRKVVLTAIDTLASHKFSASMKVGFDLISYLALQRQDIGIYIVMLIRVLALFGFFALPFLFSQIVTYFLIPKDFVENNSAEFEHITVVNGSTSQQSASNLDFARE